MGAGKMTRTARSPRAVKIGRLHQIKAQQGLSDDTYRAKLELITGKRSAADLDDAELDEAIKKFHVKPSAAHPHTRMARALWIACFNLGQLDDGSDAALDAFVKRQTGKERLAFLTPSEANEVTEGLKDIARRAGFVVPAGDKGGLLARLALVRAQWKLLAERGVVKSVTPWSLDHHIERSRQMGKTVLAQLSASELDALAREFGAMIRRSPA